MAGRLVLLFAAFVGIELAVLRAALSGPFVSDDLHYVLENVYVHELTWRNTLALFEPGGGATVAVVNYAPVHLLLHSLGWAAFGSEPLGHHVVNVLFHALASVLFVPVLMRTGVPFVPAVFGAAFFLLHPANVEAVAWISQLKSSSALALAFASVLAFDRRPWAGVVVYALALLAKPTAAVALPFAMGLRYARGARIPWRAFAAGALCFVAFAVLEFTAHERSGAAEAVLYDSPLVLVRTVVALAGRYLVMGATSLGVSAFHEPEAAESPLDPWWLLSLPVLALLGWRTLVVLRRRDPEAAWWLWALVSFGPVSQIFPFLYPMADRYLYFILPGLIGGGLLAGQEAFGRMFPDCTPERRRIVLGAGVAVGLALLTGFAWHAQARARIWRSPTLLMADAARHYPDGVSSQLLRAQRAAHQGDADSAVEHLRAAMERGYTRFQQLDGDPLLASIREHPEFRALIDEMAARQISAFRAKPDPTQGELRTVARAYAVRGELALAENALVRALEVGGPADEATRLDLAEVRRVRDVETRTRAPVHAPERLGPTR